MVFEFDPKKSNKTFKKHGIDFVQAQDLWLDHRGVEIQARTLDEDRKILIAHLNEDLWSAIFTHRNRVVRIISVREARENEKEIYHSGRI
jgi:uncharacterized DUF497 family protein